MSTTIVISWHPPKTVVLKKPPVRDSSKALGTFHNVITISLCNCGGVVSFDTIWTMALFLGTNHFDSDDLSGFIMEYLEMNDFI